MDSSSRLRTAVIGLGRIGFGYHCPAIAENPHFVLVAVCDPLADRRAEASSQWGVDGFDDVEAMLAAARPDLVVVASPTPFHRGQVAAALASGAHVFCDKPLVETVREFDELAKLAAGADRRLLAFQPARFQPEVLALKSILASGVLGAVHLIRRARCNFVRRQDWQAFRANGGGMLNNYGSHCLDELVMLLGGAAIDHVHCVTRCAVTAGDAEDFVKATLTSRGTIVDLEISQATALPGPEWEVLGTLGGARWESSERVWRVRRFDPAKVPAVRPSTGMAAAGRLYQPETLPWEEFTVAAPEAPFDTYTAVWAHVVEGKPAPVRLDETRAVLELIERCRRSAQENVIA